MMSGTHPYATEIYAASLSHWGEALFVPAWRTSVIVRSTESGDQDAAGTYPIAVLPEDADLRGGLNFLRERGLVSIVLALDDFHHPPLEDLRKHFDVVRPFKSHYIFQPEKGPLSYDKHHRYELRQALKNVQVETLELRAHLPEWVDLYRNLTLRHGLKGVHDFPFSHHEALATLDGVTAFGAWTEGRLVSCHIWVHHDGYAHSHLAASSVEGYKCRAAYAVNDAAIQHFGDAKLLNFGGSAGHQETGDGLAKFKKGFSNGLANSYICGAILDLRRYDELRAKRGISRQVEFFPAYRATPTR